MTELPDLDEMDPDDWQHAVTELAERLDGEIQDVLAEQTTPGEAKEALFPVLEPYLVDSDGGTNPARLDVWTDDGRLCIGAPGIDYAPVVYDEERGFWWYDSEESERAELSADEAAVVLAVDPGTALEQDDLAELFEIADLRDLDGAVVAIDHIRFRQLAPVGLETRRLRRPSEKDDDVAVYHRSLRLVVNVLDGLMRFSANNDEDE